LLFQQPSGITDQRVIQNRESCAQGVVPGPILAPPNSKAPPQSRSFLDQPTLTLQTGEASQAFVAYGDTKGQDRRAILLHRFLRW
jgi:hypothetical protein